MEAFGVVPHLTEIEHDIAFHYFHPLSDAVLVGEPLTALPPLQVEGQVILRFGFVEGDAVVHGDRVIYDPQNAADVLSFSANESTANSLAIVLNEVELAIGTGASGEAGARRLMSITGAAAVVIKRGPYGAMVLEGEAFTEVPAFLSDSVFKIGSGDIFSAAFAHYWGERGQPATAAAELASRAAARYVASRNVQIGPDDPSATPIQIPSAGVGPIYVAGPFFNLAQRWMIDEVVRCLTGLGASVFSPIHEVGSSGGAEFIATSDLEGLRRCTSVCAIIDGEDAGTLFEIGYARSLNIPVVALAESTKPESLTMLEGTGCTIVDDFATAMYRSIWEAAL